MSAAQSNLPAAQFGYDYVVATTQASINSTMKWFLADLTEPVVTQCYVAGAKGGSQPIDYQDLLELTHGSDPFAISPDADTYTDKDLINLYNARFMVGFRAQIGLPPMSDPTAIPDIVTLGLSASNVTYNLLCSEFDIVQLDPGSGYYAQRVWTSLSQELDNPWYFQSKVDLRLEDVTGTAYGDIKDPAVKDLIKNLSGSAFSVQQLLFDLDNAALETFPTIPEITPGSTLYTMLMESFLGPYFAQLRKDGQPLLACNVVQKQASSSTMSLTDMDIEVSPFTVDGKPAANPTAKQLSATTLDYLCASDNHQLPASVPFTWNWVDESQVDDFSGIVAINRVPFVELIKQQMLPTVEANCYAPSVRVTLDGWSQPVYNIGVTPGQTPTIDLTPLEIPWPAMLGLAHAQQKVGSVPFLRVINFHYDGHAHDVAGDFGGDIGQGTLDTHYDASVYFAIGSNVITVDQTLKFDLSIEKNLQTTSGSPINIRRTDTCTVNVDQDGQLAATMATPFPGVNNATESDVNWFVNDFIHVNDEFGSAASYLQRMVGTMLNTLPFSSVQYFVFPGASTFLYDTVEFASSGDMVSHISYADPDQAPQTLRPAGQVADTDHMIAGQWFSNNMWLSSANGAYAAVLQNDGNFVLCHANGGWPDLSRPYWSAAADLPKNFVGQPNGIPFVATMQADGNFVLYNGKDPLSITSPYWDTGTCQAELGEFTAVMQTDGNFVIYEGKPDALGKATFATNTAGIGG